MVEPFGTIPTNRLISRLRSLPIHHDDERWEVDILDPPPELVPKKRGPSAQTDPSMKVAVCVSSGEAAGMVDPPEQGGPDDTFALRAVAACALDPIIPGVSPLGYLPCKVHVRALPPGMLDTMRTVLGEIGVEVEVKPSLPRIAEFLGMVHTLAQDSEKWAGAPDLPPALIRSPGMTVARVRSFAESAASLFDAEPWNLSPDEVWEVKTPKPPKGMRYFSFMGAGGAEYGLGFFKSLDQYAEMSRRQADPESILRNTSDTLWGVTFDDIASTVPEDGVLWTRERLPLADGGLIPMPMGFNARLGPQRPDSRTLAFLEGLLRATSLLDDVHLDAGNLQSTVPTADGPVEYSLEVASVPGPPDPTEGRGPKLNADGRALQLKVTIDGSKPPIWRRLIVRDDATLEELHTVIQIAFGWSDDHMHQIEVKKRRFSGAPAMAMATAVDSMWGGDEDEPTWGVLLSELQLRANSKLKYTYDFGDNWVHTIQVEKMPKPDEVDEAMHSATGWKLRPDTPTPLAACVDGERAGPPEDCGGIWGYMDLCRILADSKDPEYEERMEWAGEIDPERFDRKAVNRRMKKNLSP